MSGSCPNGGYTASRGYEWASANAEAAADILVAAGNGDNPKLRQPLQSGLMRASMLATAPVRIWSRISAPQSISNTRSTLAGVCGLECTRWLCGPSSR